MHSNYHCDIVSFGCSILYLVVCAWIAKLIGSNKFETATSWPLGVTMDTRLYGLETPIQGHDKSFLWSVFNVI